ncbi:hypothetical protein [Actinophytocola oryzae]|nr:hypothetical protein [Actinophytocola oryzae]
MRHRARRGTPHPAWPIRLLFMQAAVAFTQLVSALVGLFRQ